MSRYTPGPWRVSAAPLNADASTRWIEVYSVDPEDDVAQVTGGNLKAAQANARLIAAAPDLLAALEQTLATLDAICEMQGFDKYKQHGSKKARAAIAKAKEWENQ